MWRDGTNWNADPMMWMGMTFVIIVSVFFLALAIWMIVSVSRKNDSDNLSQPKSRSVETLKERYARGEIGAEEYRERMRELEDDKRS